MTTSGTAAPQPPHRPTERTVHGDTVVDPYEWMRDKTDPEVISHLEAENAYADARTAHLTELRSTLVTEFVGHTQETDLSVPVRRDGWWYITRTTAGDDYPAFTRVADAGALPQVEPGVLLEGEQMLLDAQAEAAGAEFYSLGGLAPSPDHTLLAYAVDTAGDERFTLVVKDIASGEVLDETVTDTGYGLAFSTDQQWLFYARVDDAWRQHQIWRHRIGAPAETDELVIEEPDERFMIGFDRSRDGSTLVIQAGSTSTTEAWLLDLAEPTSAPVPAGGRREGVDYGVEHAGDRLLVVHNDGATGFALAEASFEEPSIWRDLLVAGEGERLLAVEAFASFVALELRSAGLASVRIIPRAADGSLLIEQAVDLTHGGELDTVELDTNPNWEQSTVRYQLTSMLTPTTVAERDVAGGETTVLRVTPVPHYDPSLYVERREWATAEDGTAIPLSVVARREVATDGTAPGYLYGYGSYEMSIDPSFVPTRLSLLDRGVVIAIAHVRGGGEMGRDWYDHGKMLEKKNSFSDFVAAAAHLTDSGLVAAGRLSAEGRSAGGLLMGGITNLAPERFRAVIAGVPFVDALTTILDPSLPLTVGEWEEWGDPLHDPEVYEYMKEYTPYENVRAVDYPAIFASTSLNDTRVFFVEPAKWVARLRETVTSDQTERPILFRCEMVAGHGGRSGRYRKWEQRADELAWLLDQLGATELIS
ncbi:MULTISPECIES: S9 family peptidase [Brachybacterium]|uniref:S9 family peptidase n=1 Tax=Brachybacterium TaxID=43668 RepID=UPI000BB8D809|nr:MULTISPECIES: S9 family peptidase [Brachybacterium]PCC33443.1 oligopeptidase B [Brachybacterium alimentarium]RCS62496.1 S9 family peptidase [Brachybacterium sp. JB7]RCS64854.1 S9 family peptidase [Brachybacterium alimentarium]RCS83631.1 S9 family peptidase [Brachybacterium alimentarium]